MNILIYLVEVSICLAIFYGFYQIALQKETTFQSNRIYLITTALLSMLLPLIKIYVDRASDPIFVTIPQEVIGTYVVSFENAVETTRKKNTSWIDLFLWVYYAGIIFMSIRLIREVILIFNIKLTGKALEFFGHPCILSEKVKTPFSFFKTIYLPEDHHFTEKELSDVMMHEDSHIKGGHSIDVLLIEIINIALWISPYIYLYKRKLRDVHEFLADAAVIKHSHWEPYAQFLIAQKAYRLQNILSNQLIYSQLKNRLIMMTQKPSTITSGLKYLIAIPILLLSLAIFSFKEKSVEANTDANRSGLDTLPTTVITAMRIHDPSLDGKMPVHVDSKWDYTRDLPVFPGCEEVPFSEMGMCGAMKMTDYINNYLQYPESLIKAGIEGKVIIKFVVGTDGYIKSVSVAQSLHPDADAAAMNLFNSMNQNVGKWQPSAENGIAKETEMWLPISFALSSNTNSPDQNEEPYTYVEEMPRFPGCEHLPGDEKFKCTMDKMFKFIYETIKYPKEEREKDIEGQVIAQFIVEPDGSLSNIRIVRGISPGLDAEAIRVVNEMNNQNQKWIPGKHEGKKVRVQYTLPFKFVLQEKAK